MTDSSKSHSPDNKQDSIHQEIDIVEEDRQSRVMAVNADNVAADPTGIILTLSSLMLHMLEIIGIKPDIPPEPDIENSDPDQPPQSCGCLWKMTMVSSIIAVGVFTLVAILQWIVPAIRPESTATPAATEIIYVPTPPPTNPSPSWLPAQGTAKQYPIFATGNTWRFEVPQGIWAQLELRFWDSYGQGNLYIDKLNGDDPVDRIETVSNEPCNNSSGVLPCEYILEGGYNYLITVQYALNENIDQDEAQFFFWREMRAATCIMVVSGNGAPVYTSSNLNTESGITLQGRTPVFILEAIGHSYQIFVPASGSRESIRGFVPSRELSTPIPQGDFRLYPACADLVGGS